MLVDLYDGRTGTWRRRDVAFPLAEELTLSVWTVHPGAKERDRAGGWTHSVWTRTGDARYDFIGTAPSDQGTAGIDYGVPALTTTLWPAWQLHPSGTRRG